MQLVKLVLPLALVPWRVLQLVQLLPGLVYFQVILRLADPLVALALVQTLLPQQPVHLLLSLGDRVLRRPGEITRQEEIAAEGANEAES
ncbi:MAG: hypothetical protein HYU47_07555 [Deltaproteobacteria bacterium]|nr:hypothetical protein [Deltaproteobacteria bacterium]